MSRDEARKIVVEALAELQGCDDKDLLLAREKFILEMVRHLAGEKPPDDQPVLFV
jgi:hypothetical protein